MRYKRVDKDLPKPEYKTEGSVGLDVYVREDHIIKSHSVEYLPLNIIMESPESHFIGVLPRSSTLKKKGLILGNSLGVVDRDYCGEEDEIHAVVYNVSDDDVYVRRGDRLFQLLVLPVMKPDLQEVDKMKEESRGGLGSTGD